MKADRKWYLKEFESLTRRMLGTTAAKNKDYAKGDDPFRNIRCYGAFGIIVRMGDKLGRLDSFLNPAYDDGKGPAVKDESVEDTAVDLAVYCLLLVCFLRAEKTNLNFSGAMPSINEDFPH